MNRKWLLIAVTAALCFLSGCDHYGDCGSVGKRRAFRLPNGITCADVDHNHWPTFSECDDGKVYINYPAEVICRP